MQVHIQDHDGWTVRHLDYPLDWEEIADRELKPQLVLTLSFEESRELLAAMESAYRGRYSHAEAHAKIVVSSSRNFWRFKDQQPYYSQSIDGTVLSIKSNVPYDVEIYETAPDEWVMLERIKSKYGDWYNWERSTSIGANS